MEKENKIWRLALVNNGICPVCGSPLFKRKPCLITISSRDETNSKSQFCDALYCSNCDLPFADRKTIKTTLDETGHRLKTFVLQGNCSIPFILKRMNHLPKKQYYSFPEAVNFPESNQILTGEIRWKISKKLCSLSEKNKFCPTCHSGLVSDYTLVPVSRNLSAKIPGNLCPKCNTIYVKKTPKLVNLMRGNPFCKGYTLDGRKLWNISPIRKEKRHEAQNQESEAKRRLRTVPNSVVMVRVETKDNQIQEYIITNCEPALTDSNIFYYKSLEGREILSAAFAKQRDKKGVLFDNEFKVLNCIFADENNQQTFSSAMVPVKINIKNDGGYSSSIVNRNFEIVDLLLYSPVTKRFELMPSTYDKALDYCYTDISIFRSHLHKYRSPDLPLDFYTKRSSHRFSYDDMASESILMGYNYSVSQANNLSTYERREILAEIVDLKILTVSRIVRFLDFLCRCRPGEKYYLARSKWESDMNFIQNYKVNPNRFLFAEDAK